MLLGDRHFSYDAAGNLTEERRGKAGRLVTRYAYDSDNRLINAETPNGVSHYRYDPLGRRTAKQTPDGETRFIYDGARLLQETRAERCRTYLFEPDSFRPLACIDRQGAASQVYYYHLDHLGTPRELTDVAGKIVWSARYRAYGALALADVAEIDNPLRFQGQYYDQETGLHYNLNRYYDPQAGRFIHQDPIGLTGGVNLFQYAVNPINWVDPLGLSNNPLSDTPLGDILIPASQRTGKTYQGQQIFEINTRVSVDGVKLKSGDYYYLDGLHKDHVEVFSSLDESKGVLNLNATFNDSKSEKAKKRKGPGCKK
jgi:RHS repeat-associated protein